MSVSLFIKKGTIKISKLKWAGLIPSETIFEISTISLFSSQYEFARKRLTERSLQFDLLDVFKEILLKVDSIESAKGELASIFIK